MNHLNLLEDMPLNHDRYKHPLALLHLGTFLRDAADIARTGRKRNPLVVVGPPDKDGWCCTIGLRARVLANKPQVTMKRKHV